MRQSLSRSCIQLLTSISGNVQLRTEVALQIAKQINKHPSKESAQKGWALLTDILKSGPVSTDVDPFLDLFIRQNCAPAGPILAALYASSCPA